MARADLSPRIVSAPLRAAVIRRVGEGADAAARRALAVQFVERAWRRSSVQRCSTMLRSLLARSMARVPYRMPVAELAAATTMPTNSKSIIERVPAWASWPADAVRRGCRRSFRLANIRWNRDSKLASRLRARRKRRWSLRPRICGATAIMPKVARTVACATRAQGIAICICLVREDAARASDLGDLRGAEPESRGRRSAARRRHSRRKNRC